jgi:hypothetical protein
MAFAGKAGLSSAVLARRAQPHTAIHFGHRDKLDCFVAMLLAITT